jgi:hypothetical protein
MDPRVGLDDISLLSFYQNKKSRMMMMIMIPTSIYVERITLGHGKKCYGLSPYTSPSNCYASPASVLPYIPLQSPSHSDHRNVGRDGNMMAFASDIFQLVGHCGLEGNTTTGIVIRRSVGLISVVSLYT